MWVTVTGLSAEAQKDGPCPLEDAGDVGQEKKVAAAGISRW